MYFIANITHVTVAKLHEMGVSSYVLRKHPTVQASASDHLHPIPIPHSSFTTYHIVRTQHNLHSS